MKYTLYLLALIFIQTGCEPEKKSLFTIEHFEFETFPEKACLEIEDGGYFYEDDLYSVDEYCYGEFGGSVKFKDKGTKKKYEFETTCPVVINKLNNKYYITTSLMHLLSRFSSVLVVADPTISASNGGVEVLVDTIGVLNLGSFVYNDELFHIITDHQHTYVSKILNKRYVILDTLIEESKLILADSKIKKANGYYFLAFTYASEMHPNPIKWQEGYIAIKDNKIQIIYK